MKNENRKKNIALIKRKPTFTDSETLFHLYQGNYISTIIRKPIMFWYNYSLKIIEKNGQIETSIKSMSINNILNTYNAIFQNKIDKLWQEGIPSEYINIVFSNNIDSDSH